MAATTSLQSGSDDGAGIRMNRLALLAMILIFSLISTGLHYPHNYIEVQHYPRSGFLPIGYDGTRLGILIAWPVLTAIGALGFWLYRRGQISVARACLAMYSLLGLITLAHFIDGSPHIPPFWYATIFTDAIAGIAIVAFVYTDLLRQRATSVR